MPRVETRGTRYRVREAGLVSTLQAYCRLGTLEGRRLAERIVAGDPVSLHLEDVDSAYNLATELVGLGVNAEADESED